MKILKLIILNMSALALVSASLFAQEFEGKIVFTISYENLLPEMKDMVGMLPSSHTFYIKDGQSRFEQNIAQGKTIVINDEAAGTSSLYIDVMGNKYKAEMAREDVKQRADDLNLKIENTGESKTILGYSCKKARITVEGEGDAYVYFTDELPSAWVRGLEGLNGFPMEYQLEVQGMTIKYLVKDVVSEKVDPSMFYVSGEYLEMPDEMKYMMGLK